jgi:replicative DNA helicase
MGSSPAADLPTDATPQAEEAELVLIGIAINAWCGAPDLEPWAAARDKILGSLRPEDFYALKAQHVFRAMQALAAAGKPVDMFTVLDHLRETRPRDYEDLGRWALDAGDRAITCAHVDHWLGRVKRASALRAIQAEGRDVATAAGSGDSEPADLATRAAEIMTKAADAAVEHPPVKLPALLADTVENIRDVQTGDAPEGIKTGFLDLDEILGPMQPGNVVVLAGRPSMGKTELALGILLNLGTSHTPIPCGMISLEMTADELGRRLISTVSGVSVKAMLTEGQVSDAAFADIERAALLIADLPIVLADPTDTSIGAVRATALRMRVQSGIRMLVIDYLQLIDPGIRGGEADQNARMGAVSQAIKGLARELEIPILALSQMSRAAEGRSGADRRPKMSDGRGSGSIEQDADAWLGVYREDYYRDKSEAMDNLGEVEVCKNRIAGQTGRAVLSFVAGHWRNLARQERTEDARYGN